MTEDGSRTGAPRDVPPPRPVPSPPSAQPVDETGVGRAARAVAEAVAGLVGGAAGRPDGAPAPGQRRSAAEGLRDVVGALAGAVGAAFAPGRDPGEPARPGAGTPGEGIDGDRTPGALLGDLLAATAPRLPIRDADRLRQAYPGATDAEIADALVARAARLTSGIGAATGGLMAAHWFAPPSLLALPLELGAETVLIGGVEVVLIGELHELYGRPASGDVRARATAYLTSWSAQRSVEGASAADLGALLGSAGMRALRRRLTRRLARAVPTAAPFLIGAALAGRGNRRATETLAARVLEDLRVAPPLRHGS
jgi:hypothetical protein